MTETDTAATGDGTRLYAGKYKTADALEAAHIELQRKLGAPRTDPLLDGHITPPGGNHDDSDPVRGVKAQLAQKLNTLGYALKGGRPEAATMLQELGMDPNLAQFATQGFHDGFVQFEKSMHDISGGQEGHKALMEFGLNDPRLSVIERHSFRTAQSSGDATLQMQSLQAMNQRYRQFTGFEPSQLQIAVPGGQSVKVRPYASAEDASRDMENPKYWQTKDPAFIAEVQARVAVSSYGTMSQSL